MIFIIPFYLFIFYLSSVAYSLTLNVTLGVNDVMYDGKILPGMTMTPGSIMGIPIHVARGELLSVLVESDNSIRDVSIHWHGFEMKGKQAYDGVVGVTQCAILPYRPYLYNFTVDEIPGTYWYHTHSGTAAGQWHDFVKAPLIVHEDAVPTEALDNPLSYGNERIIFIQDLFSHEPNNGMFAAAGGLYGALTRGNKGDVVGTHPWLGATFNGARSESEGTIIYVEPEVQYRFRVINGGEIFAFNFTIPGLKLYIISTDGADLPCEDPIEVDSLFIWNAERFDFLVTFPKSLENQTILYSARTLESDKGAFDHYVNGLIRVGPGAPYQLSKKIQVPQKPVILNCYEGQLGAGTCIPFAAISAPNNPYCAPSTADLPSYLEERHNAFEEMKEEFEVHYLDFSFNPPPYYSHMGRLDGGPYTQHVNPYYPLIDPSYPYDIHPSSILLELELGKTAIIIMRTSNPMQHPMHFHGHKFEVLDQFTYQFYEDCSIFNCPLKKYSSEELKKFQTMPYTGILKDTVVIPAGGAVVVRYPIDNPGFWLAHCHIGAHKDDGMTFIVRESTKANPSSRWANYEKVFIPSDFPVCYNKSTQNIYPSCPCYHDPDQLNALQLQTGFLCSRDWLCHHDKKYSTERANFEPLYEPGIEMHHLSSDTMTVLLCVFTLCITFIVSIYCYHSFLASKQDMVYTFSAATSDKVRSTEVVHWLPSFAVVLGDEFLAEWELTYRDMINPMRLIEVTGLAIMTGIVFYKVGDDQSNRGLRECVSLFFFSVTLWTFTRMYPAIPAHNGWRERICKRLINESTVKAFIETNGTPTSPFELISWKQVLQLSLIRSGVYLCAEGWWPCVFGLIVYPMAHVNGIVSIWFQVIGLIVFNNLCYISFGSVVGTIVPVTQVGMITSTLYSQMSLVCAGFYTTLPIWLNWFRYISYVYYTYSGIVRGVYQSTDSYQCNTGDLRVGQDWCLIETAGVIEDMKIRGINTADSSDPNSSNVSLSFGMLITFYMMNVILLFAALLYRTWKKTTELIHAEQNPESPDVYEIPNPLNGNQSLSYAPFEMGKYEAVEE